MDYIQLSPDMRDLENLLTEQLVKMLGVKRAVDIIRECLSTIGSKKVTDLETVRSLAIAMIEQGSLTAVVGRALKLRAMRRAAA